MMDGKQFRRLNLNFLGYIIAFKTAGADFQGYGRSSKFGFNLYQIRFPGSSGSVLGVADLIAGDCVFSANIAST